MISGPAPSRNRRQVKLHCVDSMRPQASTTVRTVCFSKDSRTTLRSTAISLSVRLGFHSRRPSKPPSRDFEHDRGEPPGSAALATLKRKS